jgi:hypothetical protein
MFGAASSKRWAPLTDQLDDELDDLSELLQLTPAVPTGHSRSRSRMVCTHRFTPTGVRDTTDMNWHALMRSLRLATRYSRLVDPALSLSREAPVLIVRSGCILFSVSDELLSVKAVIAHDELLLFEPSDGSFPASQRPGIKRGASRLSDSGPQGPLPWAELARKLEEGIAEWAADTAEAGIAASSCAFSCAVLEVLLDAFALRLDGAVHAVAASAGAVLRQLRTSLDSARANDAIDSTRRLKSRIHDVGLRLDQLRAAVQTVLDDQDVGEELALATGATPGGSTPSWRAPQVQQPASEEEALPQRPPSQQLPPVVVRRNVGEGERKADELGEGGRRREAEESGLADVLEVVLRHVCAARSKADQLHRKVADTEELIRMRLDVSRNEMLRLEMLLTIGTFSCGLGAVIVGCFGMNLTSRLEADPYAFYVVGGLLVAVCSGTALLVWQGARRRGLL